MQTRNGKGCKFVGWTKVQSQSKEFLPNFMLQGKAWIVAPLTNIKTKGVWDCGNGDDSKCFSLRNTSKQSFFIFKKLFLTSKRSENI